MDLSKCIINSIGLACDIVGFVLIWKYGLPNRIPGGTKWKDTEYPDERRIYLKWSKIGFLFVIGGFALQLFLVQNFLGVNLYINMAVLLVN